MVERKSQNIQGIVFREDRIMLNGLYVLPQFSTYEKYPDPKNHKLHGLVVIDTLPFYFRVEKGGYRQMEYLRLLHFSMTEVTTQWSFVHRPYHPFHERYDMKYFTSAMKEYCMDGIVERPEGESVHEQFEAFVRLKDHEYARYFNSYDNLDDAKKIDGKRSKYFALIGTVANHIEQEVKEENWRGRLIVV